MKTIGEVKKIIADVRFRDWVFCAELEQAIGLYEAPVSLVIEFSARCAVSGQMTTQRSRK